MPYFMIYMPGVSIKGTLSSFIECSVYSGFSWLKKEVGPWLVAIILSALWLLTGSKSYT